MTTTVESSTWDRNELMAQLETIEHHVRQLYMSIERGCRSDDLVEQAVTLRHELQVVRRCAVSVYARHVLITDTEPAAKTVPLLVARGRGR